MGKSSSVTFDARDYRHPKHWIMWCTLGLLRLVSFLPYRPGVLVGRLCGRFLYLIMPSRRRVTDINLARCFPQKNARERDRIKINCYENIGISLVEMSMCWWWREEKLRPLVEIRGREHVDAALESGRGAILLTGHFTSLEIGARLLALFMPVQVMYRTQSNDLFDSYLYTRRSGYFVNTVSRKNTLKMIRGIRDKIPTWYAPDQDFSREKNVFAPFLGVETATIIASSRIARSSRGAMLPFYPERKADGSGYILHIEPPIPDFPSDDDLADATAINASIEKFVRRYPESYMWIHQRFKTRPAGEPPFYS